MCTNKQEESSKVLNVKNDIYYCDLIDWLQMDDMIFLNDPDDLSHTVDVTKNDGLWILRETKVVNSRVATKKIGVYYRERQAKAVGETLVGFGSCDV